MAKLLFLLTLLVALSHSAMAKSIDPTDLMEFAESINFRKVKGIAHLLYCQDKSASYRSELTNAEDCNFFRAINHFPSKGNEKVKILSYMPLDLLIKGYECIGQEKTYAIGGKLIGPNTFQFIATKFFEVSPEECSRSDVYSGPVPFDTSLGFMRIKGEKIIKEVHKIPVLLTLETYSSKVIIPEDGSKVNASLGKFIIGSKTYVWSTNYKKSFIRKKEQMCTRVIDHSNSTKILYLYFCPDIDSLFTIPVNPNAHIVDGISYVQSMTGEFLNFSNPVASESYSVLRPHSDEAKREEAEGFMINSINDFLIKTNLEHRCWFKSNIISNLRDNQVLKSYEVKLLYGLDDSLAMARVSEGYILIRGCSRVTVAEYHIYKKKVIVRLDNGKMFFYNPNYLTVESKATPDWYVGSKINVLDNSYINTKNGEVVINPMESTELYHYGTLEKYSESDESRWNPDVFKTVPDSKKTILSGFSLDFWWMIPSGTTLVMISLIILGLYFYLVRGKITYVRVARPGDSDFFRT